MKNRKKKTKKIKYWFNCIFKMCASYFDDFLKLILVFLDTRIYWSNYIMCKTTLFDICNNLISPSCAHKILVELDFHTITIVDNSTPCIIPILIPYN